MSIIKLHTKQPDNSPIFIIGPPRSGTTLTAKIIGKHSRIFMPGETHFFTDIYARREEIGHLDNIDAKDKVLNRLLSLYKRYNEPPDQARVDTLLLSLNAKKELQKKWNGYESVFTSFMELQTHSEKKTRWGNNAPRDLFFLDEIFTFYPNAKCILCVRDARDFLVSYKSRFRVTAQEQKNRISKLYHPVISSFLWKSSVSRITSALMTKSNKNVFLLKYEDLVTSPETTVPEVCSFIGESFEDSMLEVSTHNSSGDAPKSGIFSSSIGRWKNELSADEVYILHKIAGKEMVKLGYTLETVNPDLFKVAGDFLLSPFILFRALKANKDVSGPIYPYLKRRLTTLLKS